MIITDIKQLENWIIPENPEPIIIGDLSIIPKLPGIYKFNFKNEKGYCGEGGNLKNRLTKSYNAEIRLNKKRRPVIFAIKEHGFPQVELLDWGEHLKDKITRQALETACIIEYDTLVENGKGYNILLVGNNTMGYKFTKEQRQKISDSQKGKSKPQSKQHKLNISISKKGKCTGKDNHFFGKHHTKESNEKNRLSA